MERSDKGKTTLTAATITEVTPVDSLIIAYQSAKDAEVAIIFRR